ncbi:hypothetical protein [Salinifilum aidingensis]
MACPSATMVVWTSAWLHGAAAADDLLDALAAWGELQEVRAGDDELAGELDLPGPEETPAGPALLLAALRRAGGGRADLVLPVPGDARGLDGVSAFSRAAMQAREGVVLRDSALGLVPHPIAEGILRWTVHRVGDLPPPADLPLGEAEHGMTAAMREAASALSELDVARHRPGVREEIAREVDERPEPSWPEGVPARPLRVLQRAAELAAILRAAGEDTPGGALSSSARHARAEALRPLSERVREARCAAVAAMVRALAQRTSQT